MSPTQAAVLTIPIVTSAVAATILICGLLLRSKPEPTPEPAPEPEPERKGSLAPFLATVVMVIGCGIVGLVALFASAL